MAVDNFDICVMKEDQHLIGYSMIQKEKCEIFNFVSPTFRILRFVNGVTEWRIENDIDTFYAGDIVIFNNLRKRNIHRVLTGVITYEFFDFYPTLISNESLRNIFYSGTHKVASAADPALESINLLLDGLRQEMAEAQDGFQRLSIQHMMDLLAVTFHRCIEAKEPQFNTALRNITKCIQHIQKHLAEDLPLPRLADICGYSPEYFSRVFKKYLGVSPISYIINMRLENVMHLVKDSNMTVLDAAFQSGFRSSSAFYKAFHAYKATSPTEYLKQHQ